MLVKTNAGIFSDRARMAIEVGGAAHQVGFLIAKAKVRNEESIRPAMDVNDNASTAGIKERHLNERSFRPMIDGYQLTSRSLDKLRSPLIRSAPHWPTHRRTPS